MVGLSKAAALSGDGGLAARSHIVPHHPSIRVAIEPPTNSPQDSIGRRCGTDTIRLIGIGAQPVSARPRLGVAGDARAGAAPRLGPDSASAIC